MVYFGIQVVGNGNIDQMVFIGNWYSGFGVFICKWVKVGVGVVVQDQVYYLDYSVKWLGGLYYLFIYFLVICGRVFLGKINFGNLLLDVFKYSMVME